MITTGSDRGQRGVITIFICMVLLILITLMVITAFSLSTMNLTAVGNAQTRDEAIAAANFVIEQELAGHESALTDLAFSPDGRLLVTASRRGVVDVWDARRWERITELRDFERELMGIAISPRSHFMIVIEAAEPETPPKAHVFGTENWNRVKELPWADVDAKSNVFSRDDKFLVAASRSTAQVWETTSSPWKMIAQLGVEL